MEEMPKDKVNEIKLIYVWNLPKIARRFHYKTFQVKVLPVVLKNLKSKNRFIKEDTFAALGETLNSLLSKEGDELKKVFEPQSQIFKLIETYF